MMTQPLLRQLTADDFPLLRAFWVGALRIAPEHFLLTPEELLAVPETAFQGGIKAGVYIGAFDKDHALCGFVVSRRGSVERLRHTADIGPLYVSSRDRGRGIGRLLMENVCEALKEKGLLQAELTVDASNHRAITLYRSLGFVEFGLRPRSVIIGTNERDDLMMIRAFDGVTMRKPEL